MIDFLIISNRLCKNGITEVYPKFIIKKSEDLMIRGGDFYAIWVEERGLWSTDEQDAISLIDRELDQYANKNKDRFEGGVRVLHLWDAETGMIDRWHKYCQKQMRDNYHAVDESIIFADAEPRKSDYATKRLSYPMKRGDCPGYEQLMSVLYSPEERMKIEWAIGAIVTGASKRIQKFIVLYGEQGAGKGTVLKIVEQLFEGYCSPFEAKAIGSLSNVFALEAFKSNPLVAIDNDGDLSRIEDNTRINSLVSHENMTVNEKHKSLYSTHFNAFLMIGSNRPVKITDAKSGLIRRLIDVSPSGERLPKKKYDAAMKQIPFELGAIACLCRDVFLENEDRYDNYIPTAMLGATNDFYNFVVDSYPIFSGDDGVTQKQAWEMYKTYCEDAKLAYPLGIGAFKEELKNYFHEYNERFALEDGTRVRSYYSGFRVDKFEPRNEDTVEEHNSSWIHLDSDISLFDTVCANCPAQYAVHMRRWENVKTVLKDIDSHKLHYIRVPINHIVIDFDIPDEKGNKSLDKNIAAASQFPPTYAELSKSGAGLHLHYIYTGDVSALSRVYAEHIEIKVFNGGSSLRRMLTKCNDIQIAEISSGLPLKGVKKVIDEKTIKSEESLRTLVRRNLNKEIHDSTKPSIDFIKKVLDDAYESGMKYDISDMKAEILKFAAGSSHQAEYCVKLVGKMRFKSDSPSEPISSKSEKIIFFDVEVFPNLFLVNWKFEGEDKPVVRMINPKPAEIEDLLQYRLVGFNNRRYDNHILYARLMGYSNEQLYKLSQRIISGDKNAFFGEAYNLSYTDIYDFSIKKQSLKKWEIELGIIHKELGLPWDEPVPEDLWIDVAEYCDNDVIATEKVWNACRADFTAREILADIAGMTVNDPTNSLTTRIIFGKNKHPQDAFNYRDMGDTSVPHQNWKIDEKLVFMSGEDDGYTMFDDEGRPIFPGYKYENGVSTYRGEEVGEGGYVYAEPGIYHDVALLDIASMHPSSIIAENLFGDEYTQNFADLKQTRIFVKHKEFDEARKMLNGRLSKYLNDEKQAGALSKALKLPINSVYGLTSAKFDNPFRDIRNVDNIVAKRGALFMINLKHEVQKRGFTVAHIKTDSIKIPNATPEIISFVMEYGKLYGYDFEHEATYERMCLVNDAVYIARYADEKGEWTATGAQFQVPYVFKTMFSGEPIEFADMCETKSVSTALYLEDDAGERQFIGKVGAFCPMKKGGKTLLREKTDAKTGEKSYSAATGSKGYKWLEAETVRENGLESDIDRSYYDNLVNDAIETISKYGDYEMFVDTTPF